MNEFFRLLFPTKSNFFILLRPEQWIRVPLAIVRKPPLKVKKLFEFKENDDIEVIAAA